MVLVQTLVVVEPVCSGSGTSLGSLSRLSMEKEILSLRVVDSCRLSFASHFGPLLHSVLRLR